jgi:glyoxylase-like metal-dependent hydrolase (beta-lactamase superfamily II)
MRDHIVVVDVPLNEERAAAVLAKAKETIPNKPIRYVSTSHHHWDHLGGTRPRWMRCDHRDAPVDQAYQARRRTPHTPRRIGLPPRRR